MWSKKHSKNTILNGKIDFFIKITHNWPKNDQKSVKNDQLLAPQNEVKFDYQKGDSGSAGLPEEKRVMIEAPKFNTKSDKNQSQQ